LALSRGASLCKVWADWVTRRWFFGSGLAGLWILSSSACFGHAALIFVLALEQGLVARLLSYSLPVLLGQLSYAIYLVHQPILAFYKGHGRDLAGTPAWLLIFSAAAIILAVAYLVWAAIERPCRLLLRRLWPAPAQAVAPELSASMIRSDDAVSERRDDQIVLPSPLGIFLASTIVITAVILSVFCFRH